MITRTDLYIDVARIQKVLDSVLPLFQDNRLYVTSRPGAEDPLHDGSGWLPQGESEADYTILNEPFRGTAVEELLCLLPSAYGRVRFMLMPPKTCYSFHWDTTTRLHYAIITNPACYLMRRQGDTAVFYHIPADGYVYRMDTRMTHSAMNCSAEPRVHLVIANLNETGPEGGKLNEHPVRFIHPA
jgi:hypothetical protein